jgi:hypothetical protein
MLRRLVGCPHTLYLTGNTTDGLIATMAFLSCQGLLPLRLSPGIYPEYARRIERLLGESEGASGVCRSRLLTHLCPVTGRTYPLPRPAARPFLVVDAAQSFATGLQVELFERAPVFLAPVHKHLGLTIGLGLVAVRFDLVPRRLREALDNVLRLLEHGAVSLELLEKAIHAARAALDHGRGFNSARIQVGRRLQTSARALGLKIITPPGVQRHIVALRADRGRSIQDLLDLSRFPGKYFEDLEIVRLSFHSDELPGATPEQLEDLAATSLVEAASTRT